MMDEVLEYLQPVPGGLYIDGTLGGGGHTAAILERSAPDGKVLGIDTDQLALDRVGARLVEFVESGRLILAHGNFSDLAQIVKQTGFGAGHPLQGVLLDLGFSSDQMDTPERGFSFGADGPLDMRLDQSLPLTAADIVNGASEQELADIFWRYGDESRSRQLARRIVHMRTQSEFTHTAQLAALMAAGVPRKPGAIHPATRAFQALRIAVNHELESLEKVMPQIVDILEGDKKPLQGEIENQSATETSRAGRMVIISFHSLEDRIVKEFTRREAKDCICPPRLPVCMCGHKARLHILTNKPVVPGELEIEQNPRARSAKLRAAEIAINS
ncbi:ribosomal RNA small subunit methyltransferase H [Dictyobacter arantiisoli]|uniref:Ribosomal RNA small subunit methyltransferase H n=2 Tax=Dictyobacter arantiisoli TaxID=2014874 RepID=A0A5A5TBA3_9CHLR|nr:ribosomal RNA small subunit methyltransferase H [Dictyobacter arantiisoli]